MKNPNLDIAIKMIKGEPVDSIQPQGQQACGATAVQQLASNWKPKNKLTPEAEIALQRIEKAKASHVGAIKHEVKRMIKTTKKQYLDVSLDWVDDLSPSQAKAVWELIGLTKDATILDINS